MSERWWAVGILVAFTSFGVFVGLAIATWWPEGIGVCP